MILECGRLAEADQKFKASWATEGDTNLASPLPLTPTQIRTKGRRAVFLALEVFILWGNGLMVARRGLYCGTPWLFCGPILTNQLTPL